MGQLMKGCFRFTGFVDMRQIAWWSLLFWSLLNLYPFLEMSSICILRVKCFVIFYHKLREQRLRFWWLLFLLSSHLLLGEFLWWYHYICKEQFSEILLNLLHFFSQSIRKKNLWNRHIFINSDLIFLMFSCLFKVLWIVCSRLEFSRAYFGALLCF